MTDTGVINVEAFLTACALQALIVSGVYYVLRRARPQFAIGRPLLFAAGLRLAVLLLASTGVGASLRGPDEIGFIDTGIVLSNGHFPPEVWLHFLTTQLHVFVFAIQDKALHFSTQPLRVTQVTFTLCGLACLSAAVNDLSGPKAARLCAWLLAVEPASVFFNSELHKEPLMYLAAGIAVLGASHVWRRLSGRGMVLMVIGCLIAIATRNYAGYFLTAACLFLSLHASLRLLRRGTARAIPLLLAASVVVLVLLPTALSATNGAALVRLQKSQVANATDNSNLKLEAIDTSSRTAVIESIPTRIRDVLFKPYPWQISNVSQQLGLLGTMAALSALFLLLRYLWLARGHVLTRAAPVIYPLCFLLVAYSVSSGNAGTSFRYRTNLLSLTLALLVIVREQVLQQQTVRRRRRFALRRTAARVPARA